MVKLQVMNCVNNPSSCKSNLKFSEIIFSIDLISQLKSINFTYVSSATRASTSSTLAAYQNLDGPLTMHHHI